MNRRWLSFVLALLVLTACGGTADTSQSDGGSTAAAAEAPAAGMGPQSFAAPEQPALDKAAGGAIGSGAPSESANQTAAQFGRKIILNATLSLLVRDVVEADRNVRALIQNVGGYVLESRTSGDSEQRSVQLNFKVPASRFDDVLNILESPTFALRVLDRNVAGDDVTDEFVDIESRLRTLKATEARLLEFLQQAENVEEALLVNQQLTELQGQIEQATGRINFLTESTKFSTVNLDLQPDVVFALTKAGGWRPGVAASAAWANLLGFAQNLADVAIALAIWSPVWGLLVLAAVVFRRRVGRRSPPPPTLTQP